MAACSLALLVTIVMGWGSSEANAAPGMGEGSAMPVSGFEIISAGHSDAVFGLQTDGTLTAWGANADGQTGDGAFANRSTPGFTFPNDATLVGVKQVAAGNDFTSVLKADGSVWAWGSNFDGALGDGTGNDSATPVAATGMTGVRQIAAGAQSTYALKADGTVWAWGEGSSGELGDGAGSDSDSPVQVNFSARPAGNARLVRAIYAGTDYAMAIMSDGAVWGWGRNFDKQLAIATTSDKMTPQAAAAALNGARSIALGDAFGAAILGNGTVVTWGDDSSGQLANGATTGDQSTPQATGITNALQVVAGDDHGLVLLADGSVSGWGSNADGQLGFSGSDQASPLALAAFGGVGSTRYLATALNSTFQVRSDGSVRGMGDNTSGQLADATFVSRSTPTNSNYTCGCGSFVKVVSGGYHSAGIKADGSFWMWGLDLEGQQGNGSVATADVNRPAALAIPGGVRQVALGRSTSYAISNNGKFYTWGKANEGAIAQPLSPVVVHTPTEVTTLPAGGARQVVAGYRHAFVLMANGAVYSFGYDEYGQLGKGSTTSSGNPTPYLVTGMANARQLSSGRYTSFALLSDGSVVGTGKNSQAELGNGSTTAPAGAVVTIANHAGSIDLQTGAYHTISVHADGNLYANGGNPEGELGQRADETATVNVSTPELVQLVASPGTQPLVVEISTGREHNVAVTSGGIAYTWGQGDDGQLGRVANGGLTDRATPTVLMMGGAPMLIRNITLGGYNSIALTRDGTFYTWGNNVNGQLGNGTSNATANPAPIFVSSGCALPTSPTPINQFLANGTTAIPSGGWGSDSGVVLTFSTTDPDENETLTPWVEVTSGSFVGTCGQASSTTFSGVGVLPASAGATTSLSVTVTGLTNLGNYNWRACVVDSANQRTAWTNFPGGPPDFRIKVSEPLLPTLISPADNASTTSTTPTLTATYTDTAPVTGGTVNFRVGTSATCGSGVVRTGDSANNIITGNNGSWAITPALANGTYYWCAQSTDAAGNYSGYTSTRKLIVGPATISITASTPSIALGSIMANTDVVASFSADVQTDALNGYQLLATDGSDTSSMTCVCGGALPDWTGTNATPTQWPALTTGFGGLTVRNATGGRLAKWGTGTGTAESDFSAVNRYAGLRTTNTLLHERTSYSAATDTVLMTYRIDVATAQQGGAYATTVNLTALANP
ncbi:MAG: repeat-containing protein [Thermoleophilia bacterium]|nr:repeat-containing protein [Thermoleophilia bacterium]